MDKKHKFIQVVGFSTAIALSNPAVTTAQEIEPKTTAKTDDFASVSPSQRTTQTAPQHTKLPPIWSQSFTQLIAQENDVLDTTQDILKPAQPSIPNIEPLNPSGNPLSFPTTPEEVKVKPEKPITLEQAVELSLKNNKEIEQARLEVEQSQAVLRQAQAALFPTLDLSSGIAYGDDAFLDSPLQQTIDAGIQAGIDAGMSEEEAIAQAEGGISGSSGSTNTDNFTFNGALGLDYTIYDGGQRGASIRTAEKQLLGSELNLETIVEQARFETARDYYNLQNTDAQVEIQKAAVDDATQTLKDAQLLEKAGLGTRFDVLRAEVELAQAEQSRTTAIANQNIARRQLAETLSVSHSTDLATADAIEEVGTWDLELPETIIQAFKNRAELEQFVLQKEISQEQRTVALSNARPNITANADYTINDDFQDNFDISDQFQVGLNLQWRLFDGGAAQAAAKQADKDAEIAETQFANQRNQIRFAVEQAFFQLKSNQQNIGTATKEVELADESLRLARLRFQAGVGTQTDVIEAQTQLTTARGNLLTSITDYNQSYADLTRQVSNTPDNGLQDLP